MEAQEVVEYGLQVRKRDAPEAPVGEDAPKRRRVVAEKGWETAAFKEGVAELPEEDALDAYEAMPVEFFGEAMLRGMGWVEESGVLPNGKKVALGLCRFFGMVSYQYACLEGLLLSALLLKRVNLARHRRLPST